MNSSHFRTVIIGGADLLDGSSSVGFACPLLGSFSGFSFSDAATAAFKESADVAVDMDDLSMRVAAPGVRPAAISLALCACKSNHLRFFSSVSP